LITDHQQRLELVGQMTSGVAHDLNNQIMLILNHLDYALRQIPAHQPFRGDLLDVRKAAERCTEMVGSLLAFGRPTVARLERTDLTMMLAETSRLLRRVMPARIELRFAIDAGLTPVVADETQIQQVILNLAVNAREAMPEGGVMEIEARNFGGSVALTVRDTGVGMAEEVMERMREPYFTTRGESGGTGLGLAMVTRILDEHQAVMSVESRVGEGSCFRILLAGPRMV
jgi:two-component system cell cycle sensor histidine kinase/response regulator CckA